MFHVENKSEVKLAFKLYGCFRQVLSYQKMIYFLSYQKGYLILKKKLSKYF